MTSSSQGNPTQLIAAHLESEGSRVVGSLLDNLISAGITKDCYAYRFRVKSKKDILNKLSRKIKTKPDYQLKNITDVIGIRIVTLFKSDMLNVYRGLINILVDKKVSNFQQAAPEEVIVYLGESVCQELAKEIEKITKEKFADLAVLVRNSEEGYSSIHVICRYAKPMEEVDFGPEYRLPIEVQIRTVFEDAWGEIEHKYGYEFREGKNTNQSAIPSKNTLDHFRVLKKFTDACVEYAECIRNECISSDVIEGQISYTKTIPVESDAALIDKFKNLGLDPQFIEQYCKARKLRDKAAKESGRTSDGRIPIAATYIQASEIFRKLSESINLSEAVSSATSQYYLPYYYCKMNEALCYMSTNLPDYLKEALNIYQHIGQYYEQFPLAQMRFGQVCTKLGKTDEALQRLERASELFEHENSLYKNGQDFTDILPKSDYEFMLSILPKLLGYAYWKKSKSISDPKEKLKYLRLAYTTTEKSLDSKPPKETKLGIYNNLLYYCIEFVRISSPDNPHVLEMKTNLTEYCQKMLTISGGLDKFAVEELDTYFKAKILLNSSDVSDLAKQLIARALTEKNLNDQVKLSLATGATEFLNDGKFPEY